MLVIWRFFFPQFGEGAAAEPTSVTDLIVEVDGLLTREAKVDGVQSLYLEVDGLVTEEVEVLT